MARVLGHYKSVQCQNDAVMAALMTGLLLTYAFFYIVHEMKKKIIFKNIM
jgi:hypothetical protein